MVQSGDLDQNDDKIIVTFNFVDVVSKSYRMHVLVLTMVTPNSGNPNPKHSS